MIFKRVRDPWVDSIYGVDMRRKGCSLADGTLEVLRKAFLLKPKSCSFPEHSIPHFQVVVSHG